MSHKTLFSLGVVADDDVLVCQICAVLTRVL